MAFPSDLTTEEKEQLSNAQKWLDEVNKIACGFIVDADAGNNPQVGYIIGRELYDIKWCRKAVFSKQHWDKLFSIINRSVTIAREFQTQMPNVVELKDIEIKLSLAYRSIRLVEKGTYRHANKQIA